ncbi:MAG: hypothetical protein L0Z49_10180 [Actinobacteria bacterium]|nr:hypothetical protein [Actinomycetota bacterium]
MTRAEAPGKLNLSLLVEPPAESGYHPLDSLTQTIEWLDLLEMNPVDDDADHVTVTDPEIDPEDNLVTRALSELRSTHDLGPQLVRLEKHLPVAAGLGGGSSDAAAVVVCAGRSIGLDRLEMAAMAERLGADVPLFLTGGTLRMRGFGEGVETLRRLEGFSVAVAVPEFGLLTAEVYREWDRLEGPIGEPLPERSAPPRLRDLTLLRNDLVPAAVSLEPRLGDYMADLRAMWGVPVSMTGSGSGCFGYFPTIEEAGDAAAAVAGFSKVTRGVDLRPHGVIILAEEERE